MRTYKSTLEQMLEMLITKYEQNPKDEYIKGQVEKYSKLYQEKYGGFYVRRINAGKEERSKN